MSRKLDTSSFTCGTCRASARTYHHADSAFLCLSTINMVSQHKHVKMCDACARVPAAFVCRADAASLCSSCYAEIHSANPLAGRHDRVSILPTGEQNRGFDDDDVAEAASWLVLNPEKNDDDGDDELLFGGKVNDNEYLELVEDCNSCGETENGFCDIHFDDCSVPRGSYEMEHEQVHSFQTGVEFDSSKPSFGHGYSMLIKSKCFNTNGAVSEVSISDSNSAIGTSGLYSGPPTVMPSSYLTYRESRVLRYREKKKTRKFEKKIRYASRKAYAEVRPRIKGRFAKRNGVEAEMDHMFSSTLITEAGCNVVPSF